MAGWWKSLLSGSYGTLGATSLIPPAALIALALAIVTGAVTLAVWLSIISVATRAVSSETKVSTSR
jgi:hypothetical protein